MRVSELRKIDLQLNGNCYTYYGNNYSQGKINATAGGKQFLEPAMVETDDQEPGVDQMMHGSRPCSPPPSPSLTGRFPYPLAGGRRSFSLHLLEHRSVLACLWVGVTMHLGHPSNRGRQ